MFDPFGDFETVGYLRNVLGLSDLDRVKVQEHLAFTGGVAEAASYLQRQEEITYEDFCKVHEILFSGFYPWAGRDRQSLDVGRRISKGGQVDFCDSLDSRRAVQHGLRLGNDPDYLIQRPGEVMGLFAWGHPFLDGNGRTMVVVHAELMARAGVMVNWAASQKDAYLTALSHELDVPHERHLDAYLLPLVQPLNAGYDWVEQLGKLAGLDGAAHATEADVVYNEADPVAQRRYDEKVRARQYTIPDLASQRRAKPRY
ncbi:Fic family protein [Achromobacter sp. NPDC058515]|uniref:Fic family protein n=1 Tax=Achromobacter sp. NPDC058515 TaxID=3346533 RepID=UPI00364F1B4B